MKKIGLIGGMSWESSAVYYDIINKKVREELGGFNSAYCILESLNFSEIEFYQKNNNWVKLAEIMVRSAQNLEKAGADLIILCTNTMHLCSDEIMKNVSIPFLHIADATGSEIKRQQINTVLLLGTKFTMEKDFYKKLLKEKYNINTVIPNEEDREVVHQVIYDELVKGIISDQSREKYQEIIKKSMNDGTQGVVLGCTEIPLLIKEKDSPLTIFDTTTIHAEKAVELALLSE
ncbi:aspartate/glutamate racemase family protein [Pasteurella skyensis]|uniref:Aspartate/glutamate racemase family protein n=1 Tax=Phocoenobacter skyensis TaxID=97481 RepID=A0AAJ6P156_9PAST|nr:aspartate/glutamate racemase family protein [Pasteurella skyensis]MDP8163250.1 aspartate/glutamate racemase family protein [Pasteurella skyensis]MDP8173283.1 aspartate/glutamate racemase family protein [Pasteurella skyensis]MDP8176936.1 aspartate/glutamate racemase family protein [Pasteurella skyensis]MDP8179693.1 aspartate/glutamate racemase family protein [Pasteurella skyensis]MDP8182714.1 aspartate/glutamate racemase family protein [Pasteurella skyensis]